MISSSATPSTANPNPNPKKLKNAYHIGGIQVEFPYHPYGSQLAFMGRVIASLDRAQRDGHCHALLESPTGTGKSLSLLCSTLAWQQHCAAKSQSQSQSKPDPRAMTDPLDHGGGFVPDDEPSGVLASEGPESVQKTKKAKEAPTIYFASRTHSQISQLVREYRKTSYRVPMSILASRRHYCTNAFIRGKDNLDEECKLLLKNKEGPGCSEFKNVDKVKCHPSLQKGGCHEAFDIEDLVKVGQVVKGCSYYAARSMADSAQLIFCPYNYIINPVIRGAMKVNIKGAIIVFDEAHNMEDICRDAGSLDIEEETLHKLKAELEELCRYDVSVYQPLYEMTQDLLSWMDERKKVLEKRDFQDYVSCWTGDKALRELQEANISRQSFPSLIDCATKAIENASDVELAAERYLSGMSVMTLEELFSSLTYFFSRDGSHMSDYQLAVRKFLKKDAAFGDWTHTLSLWCLNPAAVFKDIAELSLSVILTSGTLSPMNSFSSELGVQFGMSLEASHVIDSATQVWSAIISTAQSNFPLNASYKTAHLYAFQDALGKSLEEIFKIVQGGCLVFFPSYKLMEKLSKRWCETGQWSQLNGNKALFMEPRGGSQEDFDSVLKGYYDAIRGVYKPLSGRRKRIKKFDNGQFTATQCVDHTNTKGAALFAVCRGKVSEGIDFSDDNARMVIIVGIPFPNVNDILVSLKKKYNDAYKASKNLLSGSEWYCQQAFRALNQAAGRCIRHRYDYGAIIFLDERYQEERNRAHVSKWLRKSIRQYDNFDLTIEGLKSFFSNVQERVSNNMVNVLENLTACSENVPCVDLSNGSTRKQDQKLNKSDNCGQNELSVTRYNASLPSSNSDDIEASAKLEEDADNCEEVIDLCSPQKDSRPTALSMAFSLEEPEISIVKETPCADDNITTGSSWSFSKDEACSVVSKQLLFDQGSSTDCNKSPLEAQCLIEVTPQKNAAVSTSSPKLGIESHHNSSVNSCFQKRRKFISSSLVCLVEEQHDAVGANACPCTNGEANRRINFVVESKCLEDKSKSSAAQLLPMDSSILSSGPAMDKRLRVYCSLCNTPLGLPENHQYIMCYLSSSSKIHLASLHRKLMRPQPVSTSEGIPILVTDISSVYQQLFNRAPESGSDKGIWCEKDGCVFNTIFCPFCSTHNNCLGVQVMATNASNIHLLNKILFYVDQVEIKSLEESINETSKDEDPLPVSTSSMDEVATKNYFDRFAYTSQENSSGGWRTTKSKLKLPKRGFICKAEDQ